MSRERKALSCVSPLLLGYLRTYARRPTVNNAAYLSGYITSLADLGVITRDTAECLRGLVDTPYLLRPLTRE